MFGPYTGVSSATCGLLALGCRPRLSLLCPVPRGCPWGCAAHAPVAAAFRRGGFHAGRRQHEKAGPFPTTSALAGVSRAVVVPLRLHLPLESSIFWWAVPAHWCREQASCSPTEGWQQRLLCLSSGLRHHLPTGFWGVRHLCHRFPYSGCLLLGTQMVSVFLGWMMTDKLPPNFHSRCLFRACSTLSGSVT